MVRLAVVYYVVALERKYGAAHDKEINRLLRQLDSLYLPGKRGAHGGNRILGKSTWARVLRRLGKIAEAEKQ